MADLIITLLFYAFSLAGSITLGYVLLRLVYPDVRTMEHNVKLGASAATGSSLLIASIAISASSFGVDSVLELQAPIFLVTAVMFLIAFASFAAYFTYISPRQFITVAIPMPLNKKPNSTQVSKSISVIKAIEKQTTPKTQLEKLARNATEGEITIQVPIKEIPRTELQFLDVKIPKKGEEETYVSMTVSDSQRQETPWWKRKDAAAQQTEKKQEKKEEVKPTAAKAQPASNNWKRPREEQKTATHAPRDEVDAILADVVKETKAKAQNAPSSQPMHRRYLLKDSVQVIAPKTAAANSEFSEMIQDVYSQLKTAKDSTVTTADKQAEKKTKEKEQKTQLNANTQTGKSKELSIQDILGKTSTETTPASNNVFAQLEPASPSEGTSLFGQLAEISGGKSSSTKAAASTSFAKQPDVQNVKIQAEKDMACPTCRAKNTRIVFCPYCGSGMCANCSPKIKPIGPGQFIYTCPKCSEEVNVKTR